MGCLDGAVFLCVPATGNNRSECMFNPAATNVTVALSMAKDLASKFKISAPESRSGDKLYFWHGTKDNVIQILHLNYSNTFYTEYAAPNADILLDDKIPAGHGASSWDTGGSKKTFFYPRALGVRRV